MNLPTEIQILKLVVTKLEELDIPYMLSGSVAGSFYAQPRMTRDVDIVIELAAEQIPRITEAFTRDFYIDEDDVKEAVQLQSMFNIIHYHAVVKIDFIVRKDSPYRQLEFQRRVKKMIADFALWVVSSEDLIISKLFWARDSKSELQLNDVSNIIKYQAEQLDWEYIEYWIKELGLGQIWREFKNERYQLSKRKQIIRDDAAKD